MPPAPYRQYLPDLDLALERFTDRVPDDGAWYLSRAGDQIGRYRTRDEAMGAWRLVLEESGWKPPKKPVDAREAILRESRERWARNRGG